MVSSFPLVFVSTSLSFEMRFARKNLAALMAAVATEESDTFNSPTYWEHGNPFGIRDGDRFERFMSCEMACDAFCKRLFSLDAYFVKHYGRARAILEMAGDFTTDFFLEFGGHYAGNPKWPKNVQELYEPLVLQYDKLKSEKLAE